MEHNLDIFDGSMTIFDGCSSHLNRIYTCIGHQLFGMWIPDLLIIELGSVDALASSTILGCDVTLCHESFDDSVEDVVQVMESIALVSAYETAFIWSDTFPLLDRQYMLS